MNTDLQKILNDIISKYGESILSDPKRMAALFADLAQDISKPQKTAFIKCLEHGFAQVLKNVEKTERDNCKQRLAQKLHDEEGLDIVLCEETLNLLEEVMFGKVKNTKNKKNVCKKCNKELQEEWIVCPFCTNSVEKQKTSSAPGSVLSSGSGNVWYGTNLINPFPNPALNNNQPVKNTKLTMSEVIVFIIMIGIVCVIFLAIALLFDFLLNVLF